MMLARLQKLIALAWNDIRVEFSDRSTLIFFLVLPLVFTAILGVSQLGGGGDEDGDSRFALLVVNHDQGRPADLLLESLGASDIIRPELQDEQAALARFESEGVPAVLFIPAGFGEQVAAGAPVTLRLRIQPDNNQSLAVERAVDSAARQVESIYAAARTSLQEAAERRPFSETAGQQTYFDQGVDLAVAVVQELPVSVVVERPASSSTQVATGFEQASPGQLVTWTLITLLGASEVFVRERQGGTLRRLLTTPIGRSSILAGKISGRLVMGLVQMALLIGFGALVFNVNWGNSPLALVLMVLSFGLAAVSLGVMLAAFARSTAQASGLTTLLAMVLAALGGAWWPLEITPPLYQTVVKALPSTWAMIGFTDIIVRGQGALAVLPEVAVLLGFAVLFMAIGVRRLKFE
jgi:ABC-2 type transport system permease protein